MGKPTGFKEFERELPQKRPVSERIHDFRELYLPFPKPKLKEQAARCMDCGVPTCHAGCPLGNLIPDWNDGIYLDRWKDALARLLATNNFPEFTGRLCPAPCEEACVLGINEPAVTIEQIEKEQMRADLPEVKTGDTVRVYSKFREGVKERVQPFEGVVIRVKKGLARGTFTVRKVSYGIGVERIFPLHSPNLVKIEIMKRARELVAKDATGSMDWRYFWMDRVGGVRKDSVLPHHRTYYSYTAVSLNFVTNNICLQAGSVPALS